MDVCGDFHRRYTPRVFPLPRTLAFFFLATSIAPLPAQTDPAPGDSVRVTVSMNADGSRTVYQFDSANHKAVATTTSSDGKARGKILYTLDSSDRFATGKVYGAKSDFQFKTLYKYDSSGRLTEETQLTKDDAVQHRIVYAYDERGKQTGYSVLDADGRLISRTGGAATTTKPSQKSRPLGSPSQ